MLKLALSRPIPRHPAMTSIVIPYSMRLFTLDKRQADTTGRGSTDRLGHRETHGSNGVELCDFASIALSHCH